MLNTTLALEHFRKLDKQQQVAKIRSILAMLVQHPFFAQLATIVNQRSAAMSSSVLYYLYSLIMNLIDRLRSKETAFAHHEKKLHQQLIQQAQQQDRHDIKSIEKALDTL